MSELSPKPGPVAYTLMLVLGALLLGMIIITSEIYFLVNC